MPSSPMATGSCRSALFSPVGNRSNLITLLVTIIVLCLQTLALLKYNDFENERTERAFAQTVDQATVSLTQQTALYQNALLGLRALYIGSESVTTAEFVEYVRALTANQTIPGVRAFGFSREVGEHDLDKYVAWVRQTLTPFDPIYAEFDVYPVESGHSHHIVETIFPPLGNQRSLGYDLMSSPPRQQTIAYARRHGFAASPPVNLQQASSSVAVLIIAPVITTDWRGNRSGEHTVAASFLIKDLVEVAIAPTLRRRFYLQMVDLGADDGQETEPSLLFEDDGASKAMEEAKGTTTLHRAHLFGGRRWDIRFTQRDLDPNRIPDAFIFALIAAGALMAATITHLAQQRIRRNLRNHVLVNQASDCVFELDARGVVCNVDESSARITGLAPDRWRGQRLWSNIAAKDAEAVEAGFRRLIEGKAPVVLTCQLADTDTAPHWVEIRLGNYLERPTIGAVLAQVSDITKRKQAEDEIARLAFFDPLTKLPNRRLLEQRAELTFSNARRHRGRAAVLVIDLDGFKQINDNAGHATGDAVLATVAARLQLALRDSDTVARLGGDEFVVLLGQPADEADVRAAAARLTRDLAQPLNVDDRNWFVTASVGMAMYPDHGASFAELLSKADVAMYRSKRSGSGLNTMAESSD